MQNTVTKPMALDETLQATNVILDDIKDALANSSIVGDTDISAIADGTLTGAVAEFDGDISTINTTLAGLGDAATKDVANTYNAESTDPISGQGVADALETQEVESLSDTTPYLHRKSPAIGTRVMENALVGASVVVNQLVDSNTTSVTIASGHKYIAKINSVWSVGTSDGTAISVDGSRGDKFVDLTQYFGSNTIPTYVISLGATNALAYLQSYGFLTGSLPCNTGTLESVNPTAKKVVGKNQLDTSADSDFYIGHYYINSDGSLSANNNFNTFRCEINSDTTYTLSNNLGTNLGGSGGIIRFENADKSLNSVNESGYSHTSVTFEMPTNAVYMVVCVNNTLGVMLQLEVNSQATSYAPYEAHTYPISEYPLRGLFVLDGDSIKASGDVRKSDGTHEVVFDECVLGNLNWTRSTSYTNPFFYASIVDSKTEGNIIGIGYTVFPSTNSNYFGANAPDKTICHANNSNQIFIRDDSYTDATAFKTHLQNDNLKLVYEIATPTTEQLAPFDNPQISIVGGTEEFITENDVPVGHDSEYKALPPLFDDDYIQYLQEQAENVIVEIEAVTPISGTATVTLLHEEDQGEDWIVGFTGEINGHFDTDHFDYYLTARYTHAYNTNTQILNMNNCSDGDYVNIWQTGTLDFSVDGGVTVDISVTATTLTFTVNCIGDSVFGIYSSSETTGEVKYLITPARKG